MTERAGVLVLAYIAVVCLLVWGPWGGRESWNSRDPVAITVPSKKDARDGRSGVLGHKDGDSLDEVPPALREARSIFIAEAYDEAVEFFRPGGRGGTFRIYIEDQGATGRGFRGFT